MEGGMSLNYNHTPHIVLQQSFFDESCDKGKGKGGKTVYTLVKSLSLKKTNGW